MEDFIKCLFIVAIGFLAVPVVFILICSIVPLIQLLLGVK